MFASGNDNLVTADPVGTVRGLLGFRPDDAEVGARVRLGQIHRARPLAAVQHR